jgi:hypothetical protein
MKTTPATSLVISNAEKGVPAVTMAAKTTNNSAHTDTTRLAVAGVPCGERVANRCGMTPLLAKENKMRPPATCAPIMQAKDETATPNVTRSPTASLTYAFAMSEGKEPLEMND